MDKTTARRIVRETFKAPFDRQRFRNFINELLNGFVEFKAISTMAVPDAFKPHVASCQRLGTFIASEGELADVLIVQLTDSYKLDRTRTALRDFVAHKLKRGDGEDNSYKEAGLVAFVAPDLQSWRFSYVRMEYETVRDARTGKIKPEERLSPARRYSYLVGVDEECHTAQTRFLALLQNTSDHPTLAQIEEAFSVESVTKEFFREYVRLFDDTEAAVVAVVNRDKTVHDDFQTNGVSTVDFAKKLLGQIVFLYFIQKKGWLGGEKGGKWGDGPRNFLRQLADRAIGEDKGLFDEVLEPLFYDTLATDRGHDAWCQALECRIPFLNGGLFEPLAGYDWEKTEIKLPNSLFTNRQLSPAGDVGTGILDVFDRYNFTVNEAVPLEMEVAIDPEMLGKVFENLIEENRRKGLGAFYTPREIVHYMCQESLVNYLDTTLNQTDQIIQWTEIEALIREGEQAAHYEAARKDGTVSYSRRLPAAVEKHAGALDNALHAITVCDPAIGSGAFPVGMMTEIVRARTALTPYLPAAAERNAYQFKRHAIQSSLYGVDIDAGAVEIAKLRLWLSLVVDEEDVQQIRPLPNLDYKIVAGNSLLGFPFKSRRVQRIEKLKDDYFDESDHDKKIRLRREIDSELSQAFANSMGSLGYEVTFDFEACFSEVFSARGGFDIIIANPPYIGERKNKAVFVPVQQGKLKPYYLGRMDYFYFFFHLALDIGKRGTLVALISTNYYPTALGARKLRQDLESRASIIKLINFNELKLFESASGQHTMITILRKGREDEQIADTSMAKVAGPSTPRILKAVLSGDSLATSTYKIPQTQLWEGEETYLRLSGNVTFTGDPLQSILGKMVSASGEDRLGNLCNTLIGLESSLDNIFIVMESDIDEIIASESERRYFKPFYKNSEIERYVAASQTSRYILYLHEGLGNIQSLRGIWKYLNQHKDQIAARKGANLRGAFRRGHWWVLNTPRLDMDFEGEKILTPYRTKTARFAYSADSWYASRDVYFITKKDPSIDLKYVLALLNSRLYFLWLYNKGKRKGEMIEMYAKPLSEIPIKRISAAGQKRFIELTDRILATKRPNPNADTSNLEREIDELVYKLYDLTPEEIKVVEGSDDLKLDGLVV